GRSLRANLALSADGLEAHPLTPGPLLASRYRSRSPARLAERFPRTPRAASRDRGSEGPGYEFNPPSLPTPSCGSCTRAGRDRFFSAITRCVRLAVAQRRIAKKSGENGQQRP